MPTFHLNKLVRTKLPQIYRDIQQEATISELSGEELQRALVKKLSEEIGELQRESNVDLKELADILQVVQDTAIAAGSSLEELERVPKKRAEDRGPLVFQDKDGQVRGYFISTLRCSEDDEWTAYYRHEPEKYPEEADTEKREKA